MSRSSLKAVPMLVLLLLVLVAPLQAGVRDELVLRISCEGFTSRGGDILLNRDNTGLNREWLVAYAVDGNGNTIYQGDLESAFIGSIINMPPGLFFGWMSAPTANPITVRVISPAGNGLNEQVVYTITGSCAGLSTVSVDFMELELGVTSPSVAINADPPRPAGTTLSLEQTPGYLITNTGSLNIRSGDDVAYTIVGRVANGTYLQALGRNDSGTWWYVQVDDIIGWVNAEHTIIRGNVGGVPVVEPVGEIARPTFFLYATQWLSAVPQFGALRVCQIAGNQEYYVLGRDLGSDWFEIEATCNGAYVTGWIEATQGAIRNPAETPITVTD